MPYVLNNYNCVSKARIDISNFIEDTLALFHLLSVVWWKTNMTILR
jgi:hypothetical protein